MAEMLTMMYPVSTLASPTISGLKCHHPEQSRRPICTIQLYQHIDRNSAPMLARRTGDCSMHNMSDCERSGQLQPLAGGREELPSVSQRAGGASTIFPGPPYKVAPTTLKIKPKLSLRLSFSIAFNVKTLIFRGIHLKDAVFM